MLDIRPGMPLRRWSRPTIFTAASTAIFQAMEWLADSKPLDIVTLAESLESHGELEAIGGLPYLSDLAESTLRHPMSPRTPRSFKNAVLSES